VTSTSSSSSTTSPSTSTEITTPNNASFLANQNNIIQNNKNETAHVYNGNVSDSIIDARAGSKEAVSTVPGLIKVATANEANPNELLSVDNDTDIETNKTDSGYRVVGIYCYENGTCGKTCKACHK